MQAVFFFVPCPDLPHLAAEYLEQLAATLKINRKYFKRTLLYSSETATIPSSIKIDDVIRLPSQHQYFPHFMRVMSWSHYLGSDRFDADTVFLDADVVLNREIDEVFGNDFALAYTAYPSAKSFSCINTGVIFAKKAEKQVACMHAERLLKIAEELRFVKDPRFRQYKVAGVWGVDEMCIYNYLDDLAKARNTTLREVVTAVSFDQFSSFSDGISLFGSKFNADYRSLSESEWNKPSAIHFMGHPKTKLFKYCHKKYYR
jgi:hypothetical protein